MEEYPIAMTQKSDGRSWYWVMVVANVSRPHSEVVMSRSRTVTEGDNPLLVLLGWPNNFTWRILIVFTIYISTIVTCLIITELSSFVMLIIIQHICTFFFAFDLLIAIMHRIVYLPPKVYVCRRKTKWLIIESISLLPLGTFYMIMTKDPDRKTVFLLSTIQFLRLYRIPQFFAEESNAAGIPHLKLTILEYTLYLCISLFAFSVLWLKSDSERDLDIKNWNATDLNQFYVATYFSLMTFTNTGFGDIHAETTYEKIICTFAMLIGFALTTGILVGALSSDLVRREKPREKYRREYEATIKRLRRYKLTKKQQQKLLGDLNMLWSYKGGVTDLATFNMFPIPLRKEIFFDLTFGLLNRSLIFSIQERSFLRSISLAMKNKSYLPGDDIVHPTGIFRGMVCVATGVIEILSRENDNSPIISFTSGTIIGEVSLFMAIPIQTVIRAATFVELQILDTIDFYRLALKFRKNYASMREDILRRYRECRKIDLNYEVTSLDPEEQVNARVKAVKFLRDDLQHNDYHEPEPGSSLDILKSSILSLYVLIENIPRVKTLPVDLIRDKPWILRPDTTLTYVWRTFMFFVITVVIFSYPYLAAFVREINNTTFAMLLITQIIYMADIFLQCITAVPRNDKISFKTSLKEIFLTRLKSYGFYLDVLSTYELGVFAPLFNFGTPDYIRLLLSQNKLLRLWFIPSYFARLEGELSTNLLVLRILKYIYFMTWVIHFGSAILYLEACPSTECDPDRWFSKKQAKEVVEERVRATTLHPYILSLYLALMGTSTTGFGNIAPGSFPDIVTLMLIMIMGLITFNYCIAELSVTFKHRERRKTEFQEDIFAIDKFLVEHNLPQNLRKRVRRYFKVQWAYDKGANFKRDIPQEQLPKKQREMMLSDRIQTLQSVPIFKGANPGFMMVLAKGSKVRILPENEVVVYAGGLDKEMYILQRGYCRITDKRKQSESWVIGPSTSFGDLEMIQGIPVSINVKTLTNARIICIEYATYMRAVTKYPDVRRDIEALMETHKIKGQMSFSGLSYGRTEEDQKSAKKKKGSRRLWDSISNSWINVYKYDKKHNQNYWEPFESWHKFRFLKYLILPVVLKPDSLVLHVWVIIRIMTSLIIGLLAPLYFSLPSFVAGLKNFIIILQIITWIDLYVSFHVAYYDPRGILKFHPSKTAVRYLTTNFALDFVLVFPFFLVLDAIFQSNSPNLLYNGPGLIKVFQFYKFLQACNYYESDILRQTITLKFVKYVPTILIATNFATGLLILIECQILDPNENIVDDGSTMSRYRMNVKRHCSSNNTSGNENSANDFEMYLIAYYWITASMTSCGFGDMVAHDDITTIICIIIVLLGIFLYGCMFAIIASSKIFAHHNVTQYRTQITEMMMFLEKENISEKMKKRFFMHYLHNWKRTLGHTPQKTLSDIHTALKQDIVDRMYERTLRKVSVFSFMDKSFMRSIGKYIDEIYFLKGETIVKHNHIHQDIYIIYRGKIDIIAEDGKMITSMGDGGLFGNISDKPFALCSITAVAATKVDLIRLRNEDFQKTLLNYPAVKQRITSLTVNNKDYIIPYTQTPYISLDDFETDIPDDESGSFQTGVKREFSVRSAGSITDVARGQLYLRKALYKPPKGSRFQFVILADSWLYIMMGILSVSFSYISCILVIYVFAFQDFDIPVLLPYLLIDIFFYLKFAMEFYYTYFDNHGNHVCNRKSITKRYMSSRQFYIDVFANIPIDLFALTAPRELKFTVLSILRLNRLLRFYYIIEYYKSRMNALVINIILLEIGTLCAWLSVMIHLYACIWYLTACPIFFCYEKSWITALSLENAGKSEIYITSVYYVVALITTTGYGDIVSVTELEIVISTLMMILSHFTMVMGSVSFLSMITVHTLNFANYEEMISQLRKDLRRQKISNYQLKKLWNYVQLLWWRENGKQIPYFIDSAPYIMKCDVYSAMYGKHLARSFVFSDLDNTFLRQLTIYMVRYVFFPGNYIVQQGDNDATMYFVHRGEVSVMTIHLDLMETIHYSVKDNDQFGISQGLIFGQPHQFSYRAETEVEILSLTLGDWQHLFKYFPEAKIIIYDRLKKIINY